MLGFSICTFTVGHEIALGHRASTFMVKSESPVGSGMWSRHTFRQKGDPAKALAVSPSPPGTGHTSVPGAPWESTGSLVFGNEPNSRVPESAVPPDPS